MRVTLLFLAGLSLIAGGMVFLGADDPVRELGALLLLLMSTILFSSAAIVRALETHQREEA